MSAPKPSPPQERLIVYVDGFNLYNGLHDKYGHGMLWLDLVAMARRFRSRQQLVQVKYFTAPVLGDPAAQGRQAHYVAALEAKNPRLITTISGRYQKKRFKCPICGNVHKFYEEKETDVNIAVSLVKDAALHNMTSAIIVSADSDLAPAVSAAQEINPTLFVAAAFPPERLSKQLKRAMPASFTIHHSVIRQSQLPASFIADGASFTRPSKWDPPAPTT